MATTKKKPVSKKEEVTKEATPNYLTSGLYGKMQITFRDLVGTKGKYKGKEFTVYSTRVSKKDENGEWVNAYMPVYLSNSAKEELAECSYEQFEDEPAGYYTVEAAGWLTPNNKGEVCLFVNEIRADYNNEDLPF